MKAEGKAKAGQRSGFALHPSSFRLHPFLKMTELAGDRKVWRMDVNLALLYNAHYKKKRNRGAADIVTVPHLGSQESSVAQPMTFFIISYSCRLREYRLTVRQKPAHACQAADRRRGLLGRHTHGDANALAGWVSIGAGVQSRPPQRPGTDRAGRCVHTQPGYRFVLPRQSPLCYTYSIAQKEKAPYKRRPSLPPLIHTHSRRKDRCRV